MFNSKAQGLEKAKQEEFFKAKIREAFNLFVTEREGYIPNEDVPYVMRYLGRFPSEAQVRDTILPQIQDDEPSNQIKYSNLEAYMLKVLEEKEFEPDDPEMLLAAFRLLDPELKGFIETETITAYLENQGIPFKSQETKDFIKFASNNATDPTKIYYEDYIAKLTNFTEKHLESVMKGYAGASGK
eukprot:TRINITY_DN1460_c0_g1_i1.p1 TRINITY_DN1460_c0_g1~~TRINITY_DN1460_c0_g1_i1.p1  ORF type:complete len:185 (-),score=45.70 TRINITY_DN1460_c0_g1_i1:76-630(-)